MKYLKNERGNSAFYLIWILGISAVIFVIVVNITKVYLVKEQTATATQQAAFAGTIVLLETTQEGIEDFDSDLTKSAAQKVLDGGKTIQDQIDEKVEELMGQGEDLQLAYIKAYNSIIPEKMNKHPQFKSVMKDKFSDSGLSGRLYHAVQSTIEANKANHASVEVVLSNSTWRVEVKADSDFETVTDGTYLKSFSSKIPQKGYGPSLDYVKFMY
ncbi:hypothetical protein [Paenisporosarcina indica]|uniref:hypothetical protein n=1 Tax=Paenisporosarcina indica TaxID=650093 RepID=UPI00094FFF5B|nr:hypothetical protein [Paenisporosarcina indica]